MSQPNTISDPQSSSSKSNNDIIIALTVLFGTGVVCIACACYVNIRRRKAAMLECNHMDASAHNLASQLEAGQRTNVNMSEHRSRRFFPGLRGEGGQSQQTLTHGQYSTRSGTPLDRRCSMNSSMMSDYGRSPAGSTFGAQAHGMRDDDEEQVEPEVEPPPRYEMALKEPAISESDAAAAVASAGTSMSGSRCPTPSIAVARPVPAVVRGQDNDNDELYRTPTPPLAAASRSRSGSSGSRRQSSRRER